MIKIFINNEEVISDQVFSINEEMLNTSSTILNHLYPKSWELNHDYSSQFYFPLDYGLCTIYQDDELIFAGCVKNTGNINLNPYQDKLSSVQILDFKTLLSEGETLDFVISEKTVLEAIQMVIDAIKDYGFELGNVDIYGASDIIGAYSTLDKTPYDVFQYLANITQSRWTTRMIDENAIAIDFYDPVLMPRGEDLEYTQEYWEQNEIINIKYNYSTKDYRNKQIVKSNEVAGGTNYNEIIIANGYSKTFNTLEKISEAIDIRVNGIYKSILSNTDKEAGAYADFYYTYGTNQIESNENVDPYSAGDIITIIYTPIVKGREIVYNNDEVNRIATQINRKGVIARYETRNDIASSDELNQIAQTYLRYKGSAEITLDIETNKKIWNVGEVVYFDAPLSELKTDYMVKSRETKIITSTNKIFYTYKLTSSFNSENAINYFDNQRQKLEGNIEKGKYITRNIDIEETANIIFYDLELEEIELPTGNVLNAGLNMILNS